MISVVIIGSGNVAQHFIKHWKNAPMVDLLQVYTRNKDCLIAHLPLEKITTDFSSLKEADVYLLMVADDAIAKVSNQIPFRNKLVLHTSGSRSFTEINAKNRRGVFYPLQTFSKEKPIQMCEIPFCLETENTTDYEIVQQLAQTCSARVFAISENQRKSLHIAAVFVCNFTNYLYSVGSTICEENNIPFAILHPLISETAFKIKTLSPKAAQTGPAKRNDAQTIQKHLDFLTNENYKKIYTLLSKSIQNE